MSRLFRRHTTRKQIAAVEILVALQASEVEVVAWPRHLLDGDRMTILVTNGCGFVGAQIVHAANDAGIATIVMDDLSTGSIASIPAYVPVIRADPTDPVSLQAVFASHTIDAVIHLPGAVSIPGAISQPLDCYTRIVSGTAALLQATLRAEAKLIFASTAAVYGASEAASFNENMPTAPLSPLGRAYLAAEWLITDACKAHDLAAVILRHFNPAGADPYMRTGSRPSAAPQGLIAIAAEAAIGQRNEIEVYGSDYATPDGTAVRDFVHVADLADAHLDALRWLEGGGRHGTFNVGSGRGHSVLEVLEAARRLSGRDIPAQLVERRIGDAPRSIASVGRLHSVLKWKPRFGDLDSILAHAIEWEQKRPSP